MKTIDANLLITKHKIEEIFPKLLSENKKVHNIIVYQEETDAIEMEKEFLLKKKLQ